MELILVDVNRTLCYAFEEYFKGVYNVFIVNDEIEALDSYSSLPSWESIVAAGNSFGMMNSGIDRAIKDYFGVQLERRIQKLIVTKYHGELLVGQAEAIPTESQTHSMVIYAPTMKVHQSIRWTDNIYRAFWAALLCAEQTLTKVLACPGLGTGAGKVPYNEAAQQMSEAYHNFLHPPVWVDNEILI